MKRERFEGVLEEVEETLTELKGEGYDSYDRLYWLMSRVTEYSHTDNPLWTARQLSKLLDIWRRVV